MDDPKSTLYLKFNSTEQQPETYFNISWELNELFHAKLTLEWVRHHKVLEKLFGFSFVYSLICKTRDDLVLPSDASTLKKY